MKPLAEWAVGMELFDMHYGMEPVHKHCDVNAVFTWRLTRGDYRAIHKVEFHHFLNGIHPHRMYTNKMLILIAYPDDDGYWTAAWSYDGTSAGMLKLKPKKEAA